MFSKDFLWGSATSAYQIEGGADIDGKSPSIWDSYTKVPGNTYKGTTGDVAIDFYHKYEEDIDLMQEMGLKAYRFSVSWPRIIKDGDGEVNQQGIDFYHRVIDKLLAAGVEPILTIYHWDLPEALQEKYQGWEDRRTVDAFVEYCRVLFKEYGSKVKYWITFNEQNVFTEMGYVLKVHPPKVNDFQRFINVNHNANVANARVIKMFREMEMLGKVGASFAYNPVYAKSENPKDVLAMENAQELLNWFWMDVYALGQYPTIAEKLLKNQGIQIPMTEEDKMVFKEAKPDFLGINYYRSMTVADLDSDYPLHSESKNTVEREKVEKLTDKFFKIVQNDYTEMTDWDWIIDPEGLNVALRRMTSRYNLPILISESGIGAFDTLTPDKKVHDQYRINYLTDHIRAVGEAIDAGCDVIGYCTWSFQDVFSWTNGYQKRYGFVYIDRDDLDEKELKRYKKDSFAWYTKVIKENGVDGF